MEDPSLPPVKIPFTKVYNHPNDLEFDLWKYYYRRQTCNDNKIIEDENNNKILTGKVIYVIDNMQLPEKQPIRITYVHNHVLWIPPEIIEEIQPDIIGIVD